MKREKQPVHEVKAAPKMPLDKLRTMLGPGGANLTDEELVSIDRECYRFAQRIVRIARAEIKKQRLLDSRKAPAGEAKS